MRQGLGEPMPLCGQHELIDFFNRQNSFVILSFTLRVFYTNAIRHGPFGPADAL